MGRALAALAIGALCLAASAEATPGIDTWWGNGTTTNGEVKGGLFAVGSRSVAHNATTGQVYVVDTGNNRIQRFSGDGEFIAAWGRDVDSLTPETGYEICPVADKEDCKEAATSTGLGGEFSNPRGIAVNQTSGHVYVTDTGNSRIQEFDADGAFVRAFGKDVVQGGSADFEICEAAANCKAGLGGSSAGAISTNGYLSVAPVGSPNAGNVLVAETGNSRVQEFSATGQFVRAFGWDVVASGPGDDTTAPINEFEVCNAGTPDVCKSGSTGAGKGQFATGTPTRVVEAKDGSIYTVEVQPNATGEFRVQRFTLPANAVTPQGEFAAAVLHGTGSEPNNKANPKSDTSEIAVDDAGFLYAVKAFPEGTGMPAVVIPPGGESKWQQRILKVHPVSEEVVATMAANPGFVDPGRVAFEGALGLAVAPAGAPIYVTTGEAFNGKNRVFRLNEITGLGATVDDADEVGASTARLHATVKPAAIPLSTLYRFEYSSDGTSWTRVPIPDFELGNGSAGGTSSSCPLPKAASCEVSQQITGLVPNTTYQVRVVAYTEFNEGTPLITSVKEFTTIAAPPVTKSGAALWSSPASTKPSLSLGGTINPGHDRTTYYFQYLDEATYLTDKAAGNGFLHASRTPTALAAEAGHGLRDVSVRRIIAGLDPTKTYHYRLVATNSVGTSEGADRSVAPPNPTDRFFERVSNGDSWGSGVEADIGGLADDGERAMFAAQAFGQPPSLPGLGTPFVAERDNDSGWAVATMLPDPARSMPPSLQSEAKVSADLGAMLWAESSLGERERSEAQFGFAHFDGSRSVASPQLAPLAQRGKGFYKAIGASTDLSTIVFNFQGGTSGAVKLLSDETLVAPERSNLYQVSGAGSPSPELEVVNRASNPSPGVAGAMIGGVCGAALGNGGLQVGILTHAVSADGSVTYFSSYPGAPASGKCESQGPKRLYKRINGETTVEVSKSQCTRTLPSPCDTVTNGDDEFKGASADGSVVFFTSPRQLTDSDTDTTADLYVYDATPPAGQPTLAQASAGETIGSHTSGKGAKVLGVLDNANDGSRVYFVAEGALSGFNARSKAPVANQKNLYVYQRDAAQPSGRVAFVAALSPGGTGDEKEWLVGETGKSARALPVSGAEGDGHVLVFASAAKLLSEDTDGAKDVYRYDDSSGDAAKSLQCASCAGNGAFEARVTLRTIDDASLPNYAQQAPAASADLSTIVFTSQEKLAGGADENETWDLYAWREGSLSLISAGTEGFGIAGSLHASAISPDGRDILFVTRAPLVGSDTNNALDLYDARIGGGFPEQAPEEPCIDEDGCKSPPLPPPAQTPAGTATFTGPGNQPSPPACKKGQVKKKGKCVKKPAKHKKKQGKKNKKKQGNDNKQAKRAGNERGVGR